MLSVTWGHRCIINSTSLAREARDDAWNFTERLPEWQSSPRQPGISSSPSLAESGAARQTSIQIQGRLDDREVVCPVESNDAALAELRTPEHNRARYSDIAGGSHLHIRAGVGRWAACEILV